MTRRRSASCVATPVASPINARTASCNVPEHAQSAPKSAGANLHVMAQSAWSRAAKTGSNNATRAARSAPKKANPTAQQAARDKIGVSLNAMMDSCYAATLVHNAHRAKTCCLLAATPTKAARPQVALQVSSHALKDVAVCRHHRLAQFP